MPGSALEVTIKCGVCRSCGKVRAAFRDLGAMLLIVGRTLSAIAAGSERRPAPPTGECGVCCSCGRADLGAMLLIAGRTLSANRGGAPLLQGYAVSVAFVGGSGGVP
ncbi:hypothetical protein D9M68_885220 [compost metagenome]